MMAPLVSPLTRDKIRRIFEPVEVTTHGRYTKKVKLPREWMQQIREIEKEARNGKARGAGGAVTAELVMELVEQGVLRMNEPFYMWIYRSPLILKELDEQEALNRSIAKEGLLPRESRAKTPEEMRETM